jgi:site-specific DNA-methyltransferase (adenine-specific)
MDTNILYYGDNLEILKNHIPEESVDLVYLDPPFNSSATYNVLFKEPSGKQSEAQLMAFEDTWQWGLGSEAALRDLTLSNTAPQATKEFMSVLPDFVGQRTPMRAYLTMMAIRLVELLRVLKSTGSIYLHCDPTASHYIKIIMDTIFDQRNFRNEIVWQRTNVHNAAGQYGRIHDIILFYTKGVGYTWNPVPMPYSETQTKRYRQDEEGHLYTGQDLTASRPESNSGKFEWRGTMPPPSRGWGYTIEQLETWWAEGKILKKKDGTPRMDGLKVYLDEMPGKALQSVWTDVPRIANTSAERLGYPTQKPIKLLERIISSSSNEGDVVLDPFCGCGTALVAAQRLNRKWIGIDITHLAISTMKWRLETLFPNIKYKVVGEPVDLEGAKALAEQDKYQFQWWAVSLVKGQPYGNKKKGSDTGIDGYLYYADEKDKIKKAILSVKGGGVSVAQVRDLVGVLAREKADIGVFLTLEPPTKPMESEAALQGFYHSPNGRDYPKLQIISIEDALKGKTPNIPPWLAPIPQITKAKTEDAQSPKLL